MNACGGKYRVAAESGQVAFEAMLLIVLVALVLLLPWHGGASLAEQLRHALNGFMQATLVAMSII